MATMTATAVASKNYSGGVAQTEFKTSGAELYMGYDYSYSRSVVGCIRFTLAKRASTVLISGIKSYGFNNTSASKPLYYAVSQTLDDSRYINKSDADGALGSVYWTGLEQGRDISLTDVPAGVNYLYIWGLAGDYSRSRFRNMPDSVTYEPVLGSSIASISSAAETLGSINISMDRADSSHVHKATFKCGSLSLGESALFGASLSYVVPRDWFSTFFDKTEIAVTVSVQTYSDTGGTVPAGEPVTAEVTVRADSGMRPVLLTGFAEASPYNTGAAAQISGFVKGKSRAKVIFRSTKIDMSAAVGAEIAGYSVTCQGSTDSAEPYLTPILTGSGSILCTVTDSRGRSASGSIKVTVMDYAAPKVSTLTAFRCDSAGAADEGGAYISVTAKAIFSSLDGQNSAALACLIQAADGSFDQSYSIESGAAAVLGGTLSPDMSYTVTVTVTDTIGGSGRGTLKLPTRKWALKFNEKGTAAAFGGAPEGEKLLELKDGWGLSIGGRPAGEIFGAPLNLLDNSDFSNPVAQAGIGGKHGNFRYPIDRWIVHTATITAEQQSSTLRLTSDKQNACVVQRLAHDLAGKTVTIAAKIKVNSAAVIGIYYSLDGSTHGLAWFQYSAFDGIMCKSVVVPAGATNFTFRIYPGYVTDGSYSDVYWAALYEGEYTAANLPEYRPKGYGRELLECQRYYRHFSAATNGYLDFFQGVGRSNTDARFVLPISMRIAPSVVSSGNFRVYVPGGNVGTVSKISLASSSPEIVTLSAEFGTVSTISSGVGVVLSAYGDLSAFIALSADL